MTTLFAIYYYTSIAVVISGSLISTTRAFQSDNEEPKCAKQCTCALEYLSEMPMMKWLTIPMSRPKEQNETTPNNNILDEDDDTPDAVLQDNPYIHTASCMKQDGSNSMSYNEFTPALRALTILYGSDMSNKTIKNEFTDFLQLVALDIQGYKDQLPVRMHHEALLPLHSLRYLNVQHVSLFPISNSVSRDYYIPVLAASKSGSNQRPNITFMLPNDPEIVSYDEYKKRQSVSSMLGHLSSLHFLRLLHCHIDAISWDLFDGLTNLRILSLEGNHITEVPEYVFYSMPELRSLVLSHNKISLIHETSLAGLFHLETLDLSDNQLKHLSDMTFSPLYKLHQLSVLENPLESISSSTFEVTNNTIQLWISSTQSLTLAEDAFNGLSRLQRLEVLGLHMAVLGKNSLTGVGLVSLTYLRVAGNVQHLDFDAFTGSPLLQELILQRCSLRSVSVDAFYGLAKLTRLDLSHNQLQTLAPGVFDQLYSLKELLLSRNQFVTLPRLALVNLQHVQLIRLDGNKWNCSCDMADWMSLNLNKVKETQLIHQPCTYHYDKIPCVSSVVEVYVSNSRVTPRCSTPAEYEGWNALQVVHKKLHCVLEQRMLHHSRKAKQKTRRRGRGGKHMGANSNGKRKSTSSTSEVAVVTQMAQLDPTDGEPRGVTRRGQISHTSRTTDIEDTDNNLGDLSQFLDQYQGIEEAHRNNSHHINDTF